MKKRAVLCILDGWGYSPTTNGNAIALANTPVWDTLWQKAPRAFLKTSGLDVGLPAGQMGNSEVGHMNIGAGRVVMQELPRLDAACQDGSLASNPTLLDFISRAKQGTGTVHLCGLLSPGGVHSHQSHLAALAKTLVASGLQVVMHAWLDGRDTPPQSALDSIHQYINQLGLLPTYQGGTMIGRYYSMDRDNRFERVELAYNAMVEAIGTPINNAIEGVQAAYKRGETDEFIKPLVRQGYSGMRDGDSLLIGNFRADRVRQILHALLDQTYTGFNRRRRVAFAAVAGLTPYSDELASRMLTLFTPQSLHDTLGEVVSRAGLKQLRLAETEKYPHVTYFLNGGVEKIYDGEDRIMVPSPKVATYDLQPEMSAAGVVLHLVQAITNPLHDLIVVNFANPDMVGHTGSLPAAIKAVETIDACLGQALAAAEKAGVSLLVTADHGNAEQMLDPVTGAPHTAHTINPVPVMLAYSPQPVTALRDGRLADLAPTLLALLGLAQPTAMTGVSLLEPHAASRLRA